MWVTEGTVGLWTAAVGQDGKKGTASFPARFTSSFTPPGSPDASLFLISKVTALTSCCSLDLILGCDLWALTPSVAAQVSAL